MSIQEVKLWYQDVDLYDFLQKKHNLKQVYVTCSSSAQNTLEISWQLGPGLNLFKKKLTVLARTL
jgi:hypothetical protein